MKNPFTDDYGMTGFGFATTVIAGITFLFCVFAGLMYWVETAKCNNLNALGLGDTYVSLSTGCLVKYKGDWVSADTLMSKQVEIRVK